MDLIEAPSEAIRLSGEFLFRTYIIKLSVNAQINYMIHE